MKDEHVIDELSAYLDGAVKDPQRIACHLERCPACAQRYQELRALSLHLRALPVPEAPPAFLTRVMARVGETSFAPAYPPVWQRAAALAVAAGVVAVLAGLALYRPYWAAPSRDPVGTVADNLAVLDEDALVAEIEQRLAQGADIDAWTATYFADVSEDLSADDMIAGLSETEWFGTFVDTWETEADLDTLILALDQAETETFKELLRQYAQEDQTI